MSSPKVGRRRFLKYVGGGVVAAAAASAGYLTRDYWGEILGDTRPSQLTLTPTTRQISTVSETVSLTSIESSAIASTTAPYDVPEPMPVKCAFNVSAAYLHGFDGYHPRDTWSNYHLHPLLGYYETNDPRVADWHIKWAVEHGVSIFAVHFLENSAWGTPTKATQNLNNGLLKAKHLDYIRFHAFYDSLAWSIDWSFKDFERLTEETVTYLSEHYFGHPRYLRHENRPVLDIFGPFDYVIKFGKEKFISSMESIRSVCRSFGYDVYLVGYAAGTWNHNDAELYAKHFDALSFYNMPDAGATPKKDEHGYWTAVAPYDSMVTGYVRECKFWSTIARKYSVGFIPSLCPAFSNRPFYEMGIDHLLFERTKSTPAKFKEMCEGIKPYVDPELSRVHVDAWNEFPEDSLLEPTVEDGFGYIDALRDAYCEEPADGWPPNLYPTKEGIKRVS